MSRVEEGKSFNFDLFGFSSARKVSPMKKKVAALSAIIRVLTFRIPHGGKLGCLLLALSPCGCCIFTLLFKYAEVTHEPPKIIGVRKDAQGNVVQQIILEASYRSLGRWPGPHGSIDTKKYSFKYFLEEPGKPRRELTFLRDIRLVWDYSARPVDDISLWVSAGYDQEAPPAWDYFPLLVIVFDDTQIVHRRPLKHYPNPNPFSSRSELSFENGNRKYVFRSRQGLAAYDVITDTVAPWKPGKD